LEIDQSTPLKAINCSNRANQHQQKIEGPLGKCVDVLGDPLIGVVDLGVGVQFVVGALAEVAGLG
jgi:hypothetical protein